MMGSELQREIAQAVRAGTSLDEIEAAIIAPADADEDEKAALWLLAEALRDRHPSKRESALATS
jgi:hypothetical protein